MTYARALIRPPIRLPALSDRWATVLRAIWILFFGLSVLTVVVSTIYAVRASYWTQPVMQQFGLDFQVTTGSKLIVGTLPGRDPALPISAEVIAIDGKPVPPDLQILGLAERLDSAPGPTVDVTVRHPGGGTHLLSLSRTRITSTPAEERERNLRILARLVTGVLACAALLVCSLLLALRRPDDPVAMLLAFAFVGMAATIDPPLQFWLWTDRGIVSDTLGAVFFYLLLIALASFPDGLFFPRFSRWLIPLGIPLAIFVSFPHADEDLRGIAAVVALLAVLASQIFRFRREATGIVRQQIKWAGFGFAAGLLLLLAAVVLAAALGDDPNAYTPLTSLAVLLLFSSGMAAIALGLLVALLRFRLWEADTVITRSAAYAVVTLIVGVVWAASSDLVKMVIEELIGRESEIGATTVGAMIAAGVFAPTQSAVLGWTRARFGGPLDQIRDASKRLKTWGLTEAPEEVATRALAIIDRAVHPDASAILLHMPTGQELIAAREASAVDDPRLVERLALVDDEIPIGTLLIGRRSDGNRYNRQELEAIRKILPTLAEALQVSRGRYSRDIMMQQRLEEMAARLAQLEGGAPKPASS
ncbi:hypothetical protein [Sphingosinicella rhizophila]|uniref:Uncharacterized protein n=1 Tax=Sphingosinicella rhizophila TaxID=3050082 RepID=A0ABU3Q1N3_9SPHN|nr:hypothetical protein [Sphingosinicella sp. GR2756]MDT9597333.1 hypothetical protein [Sphingosinicella sp. GR2756]